MTAKKSDLFSIITGAACALVAILDLTLFIKLAVKWYIPTLTGKIHAYFGIMDGLDIFLNMLSILILAAAAVLFILKKPNIGGIALAVRFFLYGFGQLVILVNVMLKSDILRNATLSVYMRVLGSRALYVLVLFAVTATLAASLIGRKRSFVRIGIGGAAALVYLLNRVHYTTFSFNWSSIRSILVYLFFTVLIVSSVAAIEQYKEEYPKMPGAKPAPKAVPQSAPKPVIDHDYAKKHAAQAAPKPTYAELHAPKPAQSVSVPDEIRKYKELLDMGAITQEEYDAKKKQLLGS